MPNVRAASEADLPGILAIYNDVIATSTAVYTSEPSTLALALGKHVMIGVIDAANYASIRFHARLGFEQVAAFREVGHKFGRWLDLIFMQRFLDPPGSLRG